jgi:hypothetical protein
VKLRADLYAALALSALACGSPFEAPMSLDPPNDAATRARSDVGARDVWIDVGNPPEANPPEADPPEADPPADHEMSTFDHKTADDAACTPFGTETVLCPVESGTSTAPGTYCTYTTTDGTNVLAATPVECQCKATYTCACLESTVTMPGELCPTGEVFFECDNSTGVPIVYCEIP